MPERCYIGIDTSNYTTSLALVSEKGEVIANLKAPLPVRGGECGLRQSDAVFAHVKNLPQLFGRLQPYLRDYVPAAVAVSEKPRDAKDSYMPCFLTGVSAASAFAAGAGIPLYTCSHQSGHLMAALYSSGALTALKGRSFGAFHVSGGTTDMLYVTPNGTDFSVTPVGGSADLHAGQAVDRIGVMLGLAFPAGPALEELAMQNTAPVPTPRVSVSDGVCHLSGLQNLAANLYKKEGNAPQTAAFTLRFLSLTLAKMVKHLRQTYGELPLVFSGGVMSNRLIAADLVRLLGGELYFAEPAFSADNAAGVALLCRAKANA